MLPIVCLVSMIVTVSIRQEGRTGKEVVSGDRLLPTRPSLGSEVKWQTSLVQEDVRAVNLDLERLARIRVGAEAISLCTDTRSRTYW
jgi:hypothetical protein